MRVGILTFHSSYNFGANLQVLALQSALQRHGVEATTINFREPAKMEVYKETVCGEQAAAHESFFDRYLDLSPLMRSAHEVEAYCRDQLDLVMVGSDAVFRLVPKYEARRLAKKLLGFGGESAFYKSTDALPPYWMDWKRSDGATPVKASVAASAMGTKFYLLRPGLYPKVYRAINGFDYISVRDDWTKWMIECLGLGRRAAHLCPDPVFSLNESFGIPASEDPVHDVSRTILLSGRFPAKWRQSFVEEAHAKGFSVSNLPNPEGLLDFPEADFTISLPMSPLSWYLLLARAAAFVGGRFHALVGSVANGTPAISVDTPRKLSFGFKKRNKIYDLWKRIGATHRFFTLAEIVRTPVEEVLDTLFDTNDLQSEMTYAEIASTRFEATIKEILAIAS